MRSKWTGHLKVSLVSIPIRLYKATESKATISFNELHRDCNTQLKRHAHCDTCNKTVDRADIVKGYQIAPGKFVTIEPKELEPLMADEQKVIDVTSFVPGAALSPLFIESTDFIAPDGVIARLPFVTLRDALAGDVGIGTFVHRQREDIVAVQPYGPGLLLHHLRYAAEIRSMDEVPELADLPTPRGIELQMTGTLVKALKEPTLDLTQFIDRWNEGVKAIIQQKAAGETVTFGPTSAPQVAGPVLLDALRASLDAVKPKAAKATIKPPVAAKRRVAK